MVQSSRRIHQLVSPVMWTPDQAIDASFVTPVRQRYLRASTQVCRQVHDYALTLWDLGIDIDDAMLERMLDAAEKRERDAAELECRPAQIIQGPGRPTFHDPIVYYMRMDRLVKIGTSTSIRSRTETLMTQGVMAVEWGDRDLERRRHKQFVDLHSHGEWFHLGEALVDHVAELRERFFAEQGRTVEDWLGDYGVRG